MSRYLLLLIVGAVILADGYVYGLWTGRWHETQELSTAPARLERIPLTVGDWQGTSQELDPKVVARAEFAGYVLRSYENRRTGAVVSVLVACARPGPLCVHTPELCYRGAGFQMLTEAAARQTVDLESSHPSAEFWKATFARDDDTTPEQLRVVWSWRTSRSAWTAPDNPRWKFAGEPVLYKVYVAQKFVPRHDESDAADCLPFLRDLLPELDKALTADH